MLSVKGLFKDGTAQPTEPIEGRDGQQVIIVFLEDDSGPSASEDQSDWDDFMQLVEKCAVETGVTDLAHEHDHYLYGKPKRQ